MAAGRHRGEGESTAGAIGTAGQGTLLPHQPQQHPPGCTGSLLTPLAPGLCPPLGEQLFSEQSGKGRQFTTGESPVCSNTLPRGLGTLGLFPLCQQPAMPHQLSLCQGTDMPIFNNFFPRSETFNQPDQAHTCGCLMNCDCVRGGHKADKHSGTVLGKHEPALFPRSTAGSPVWKRVWVSTCPNPSPHWLSVMSCPCINPR